MSRQQILSDMEPIIKSAEESGLWLFCQYQQLWFSPSELRKEHANGRFIWGPVNWEVRSPLDLLESAKTRLMDAATNFYEVKKRIGLG